MPAPCRSEPVVVLSTPSVRASLLLSNKGWLKPHPDVYQYNEPFDLINLIPIVRDINKIIPRQFALAEHQFTLAPRQMVIQHEFLDVRTRTAEKNSIISFSYTGVMAGQLGTSLDMPLFYSSILGFSNWSRYPMGNYTMTIDRDNPFSDERMVYIKALTRF